MTTEATSQTEAPAVAATPAAIVPPASAGDAAARLAALSNDKEWSARLLAGDAAARQQLGDLSAVVAAGDDIDTVLTGSGPTLSRELAGTVADFRLLGLDNATIAQALTGGKVSAQEVALAKAHYAARTTNAEWTARYLAGDMAARRESMLISIILSSKVEG